MNTVQECIYLRIPKCPSFIQNEEVTSLPGSGSLKSAAFSILVTKYCTGNEKFEIASVVMKNVIKGNEFDEWINGKRDQSPFKENEIWEVKSNLNSIWHKFSFSLLIQTVMRSILIANSYVEYFDFLTRPEILLKTVPLMNTIISVARVYTAIEKSLYGIQMIKEAENPHTLKQGYGAFVSGASDTAKVLLNSIPRNFLYQISPLAGLVLSAVSSIGSRLEVSPTKKIIQTESFEEMTKKKPRILIPN